MQAKAPAWREGVVTVRRPSGGSSEGRAGGDGLVFLSQYTKLLGRGMGTARGQTPSTRAAVWGWAKAGTGPGTAPPG